MAGIVDAGAVLLVLDLAVELGRDAVEFRDHRLDLGHLAPLLVDLKLLRRMRVSRDFIDYILPRSPEFGHAAYRYRRPRGRPDVQEGDCGAITLVFGFQP